MWLGMGILHNSKTDDEKILENYQNILLDDEEVVIALKQIRDLIILTNKRLIIVDKQGVTGRKKMITCYVLSRITRFEFENSPYFDIDSEMKIYFAGSDPVSFELSKSTNVFEFSKLLFQQIENRY